MHRKTTTRIAAAVGLALAACSVDLLAAEIDDAGVMQLQLTPAGEFKPVDGREMPVPAWRIDAAAAARVIQRFTARKTPPVIDYEHQTLNKEANGQPAPAAAFIRSMTWREGKGLYGTVELTARARGLIDAREYRYFSPVFTFDRKSGEVLEILMGALTNNPAIDGMEPLTLRAAATFGIEDYFPQQEIDSMNPLLAALVASLGLPAATTEDQATAALTALGPLKDVVTLRDGVRAALGLDATADSTAVVAACTSLKAAKPNPAEYVPIAALTQVQTELAVLSSKFKDGEVSEIVTAALADGRLLAGEQETWARELGRKDLAALTSYLKSASPIAALRNTQTGGKTPGAAVGADGLSADELAVCTNLGLTAEQFKAGALAKAA